MSSLSPSAPHILIIDDDRRIRELLHRYLSQHDMVVNMASDAIQAREKLDYFAYDLIVCDVMMPGEDGFSLTKSLVNAGFKTPILLLTAKGDTKDRIEGLESGADDYLVKPFEPRELLLRIQSILRRQPEPQDITAMTFGSLRFDKQRNGLFNGDDLIPLTTVEAQLLTTLIERAGQTISREELLKESHINGNERTVDVQVTRLRRKIEPDPKRPRYLQTIRGEGYVLRPDQGGT